MAAALWSTGSSVLAVTKEMIIQGNPEKHMQDGNVISSVPCISLIQRLFKYGFSFCFLNVYAQWEGQVTKCCYHCCTNEDAEALQPSCHHQHAGWPKKMSVFPQSVLSSDLLAPTSNQLAIIKGRVNLENQSLRSPQADGQALGLQGKRQVLTSTSL